MLILNHSIKRITEYLFHPNRFHKLNELQIGGHCGCCGKWVFDCIVSKEWVITLCDNCNKTKNT